MYFGDVAAGGSRTAIDIEIAGNDLKDMSIAAEKLKSKLLAYEGLFDILDTSYHRRISPRLRFLFFGI